MKQLFSLVIALFCSFAAYSQAKPFVSDTIIIHKRAGQVVAQSTGKTFKTNDGQILPIMQAKSGQLFVVRREKSGKSYNHLITTSK